MGIITNVESLAIQITRSISDGAEFD